MKNIFHISRLLALLSLSAWMPYSAHANAVLDDLTTSRNNGAGDPLWEPYQSECVNQSLTIGSGLMNNIGSVTTETAYTITGISQTNPAVVTTSVPASWQSDNYLGNPAGDLVILSGITGTGCSALNAEYGVQRLTPTTFALYTNNAARNASGSAPGLHTYAGGGTGKACINNGWGCGMYWQFMTYDGAYYQFAKNFIQSGTWNPNFNRQTYTMRCDKSLAAENGGRNGWGPSGWNQGDYVRSPSNTLHDAAGMHYYRGLNANIIAGVTMNVEVSNVVDHRVSTADNQINYPPNVESWLPAYDEGNTTPVNQFDGQTRFYNQMDGDGITGDRWSGNTCHYGNFTYTEVDHEPDTYVHQVVSQYTGTQYEIDFAAAKSASMFGFVPTSYQIRYSASDLKAIGFSNGTDGGTVMSPGSAYMHTEWLSPAMAQAPTFIVGIHFTMRIAGLIL